MGLHHLIRNLSGTSSHCVSGNEEVKGEILFTSSIFISFFIFIFLFFQILLCWLPLGLLSAFSVTRLESKKVNL